MSTCNNTGCREEGAVPKDDIHSVECDVDGALRICIAAFIQYIIKAKNELSPRTYFLLMEPAVKYLANSGYKKVLHRVSLPNCQVYKMDQEDCTKIDDLHRIKWDNVRFVYNATMTKAWDRGHEKFRHLMLEMLCEEGKKVGIRVGLHEGYSFAEDNGGLIDFTLLGENYDFYKNTQEVLEKYVEILAMNPRPKHRASKE
jgi:hypothetical protein